MTYLEQSPSPPLAAFVRKVWYVRAPNVPHAQERVLPNGCLQIVISLAADRLTDSPSHSILLGARCSCEVIDTRDLAELVGIVLQPGGLGPWLRQRADAFFEQSVELNQVWNDSGVRDRLNQEASPQRKLDKLDALLALSLNGREVARRKLVQSALPALSRQNVKQAAQSLGVSERRLH